MKHTLSVSILAVGLLTCGATYVLTCGKTYAEPAAGTVWTEPSTRMEFVWVPTGCFNMGSRDGYDNEKPVHKVCIKGFWMAKYEVTQAQYQQVMGGNPSYFKGPNNPVDQVTVEDAANFIEEMGNSTGTKVKLPSEAEWEYACRAGGAHEKFCGSGASPDRLAWYKNNSGSTTHPVGQLAANDWGLYDMSGNVSEWTRDCGHENYLDAPADDSEWKNFRDCSRRAFRGGSDNIGSSGLRAARRGIIDIDGRSVDFGFRVARMFP